MQFSIPATLSSDLDILNAEVVEVQDRTMFIDESYGVVVQSLLSNAQSIANAADGVVRNAFHCLNKAQPMADPFGGMFGEDKPKAPGVEVTAVTVRAAQIHFDLGTRIAAAAQKLFEQGTAVMASGSTEPAPTAVDAARLEALRARFTQISARESALVATVAALAPSEDKSVAEEVLKSVRHLVKGCGEDIDVASGRGMTDERANAILTEARKGNDEDDEFAKELGAVLSVEDVKGLEESFLHTNQLGAQLGFLFAGEHEANFADEAMNAVEVVIAII